MSTIDSTVTQQPWNTGNPPRIPTPTARANRRRLLVFLGVFGVAGLLSLSYTFLRPAEYRASARIEITPPAATPTPISMTSSPGSVFASDAPANQGADGATPVLTEVELLTSRPVLQKAVERLKPIYDLSSLGSDPVAGLQSVLQATSVSGTKVVELAVTGRKADILAPLLDAVLLVFRADLDTAYANTTHQALVDASAEAAKLEESVNAKQKQAEAYLVSHNIVSPERSENQVLAGVSGLSTSLSKANENLEIAEGKLRSLRDAAAAGETTQQLKDATLNNLQQQAAQLRLDLSQMSHGVTQKFLDMDPSVRAKRMQVADLDEQIKKQRAVVQRAALLEAEQDVASARETVRRLKQQDLENRKTVREFAANFDQFKVLRDDLAQIQALYRAAVQRKLRLEASELERAPSVKILESPATPHEPWRPLYWRDAGIAVGASFLLGLLVMWVTELFNRPEPHPALVIAQPIHSAGMLPNAPERLVLPSVAPRALPAAQRTALGTALGTDSQALLTMQSEFPRELRQEEITALLGASSEASQLVMLLLLSGIRPEDALALRSDDVNLDQGKIRIAKEPARELPICAPLARRLASRMAQPGDALAVGSQGRALGMDELDAALLCAAHDAAIQRPAEITPSALWHTYVAFLVRQGIRFSDLMQITGNLPTEILTAYSSLSPEGARLPLEAVKLALPAVEQLMLEPK